MSTLLQELNSYSLRITQAIELNDWEQLSEILAARQMRLESLSDIQLTVEEQRVLQSLQTVDGLFIEAVLSKKMALLKEFQTVAQGQKGIKAYYATAEN